MSAQYPTPKHAAAASSAVDFFSEINETEAVLLVGSCARGRADEVSDVDIVVLVRPTPGSASSGLGNQWNDERLAGLSARWHDWAASQVTISELEAAVPWSGVDVEVIDGNLVQGPRGWTSWPDPLELQIGNYLVHSETLWKNGSYLDELNQRWLPYYGDDLRLRRLRECVKFGLNNLDHVKPSIKRGLPFHAFDRLYHSIAEFLQGLFIARRIYPISYNKWIRDQVVGILGLPKVYEELVSVMSIGDLESEELVAKSVRVRELFYEYVTQVAG
jgi:hypothetical protein